MDFRPSVLGQRRWTFTHDLLPLPYTCEAAKFRAQYPAAQDYLEVPIAVENVSSYAEFNVSQMTEWEFLERGCRARGLRHPAGREQYLCFLGNHEFDPWIT